MRGTLRENAQTVVHAYQTLFQVVLRHRRRFVKFGVVGASGVVVNFTILALLVEYGQATPVVAAILATEGAILSNFTLNDRWTFRGSKRQRSWPMRAWRYHAIALGGMVLSVSILAGLVHLGNVHYLVANLFAIGAATVWNYGGNSLFTWSSRSPETGHSGSIITIRLRRFKDIALAQIGKVL